ncbi:hypothetical protein CAOG_02493 [Capsaspora owczarzaki ATCC 30864]|uniref:Pyrrolo-quinoline quinone repeat domain-containing protein n=1 Tax=Capsaspora owczarzaki (strain ATCC 30864) TaxID=595528 RepID=A0A0D2X1T1_CAPO3|nr:hypothetical protein CAOG_02493 [Capsaspora owczarzaki ATCC 30864]KJE91349.1 hypothetical protein CAOG_002493 [Capsaspora owczarzaki ATCC 30864]|eukprot:XP_004349243.1 hypothetical protein CAOG_02493 [Capsaspora owczarzaki ATCC 30864]
MPVAPPLITLRRALSLALVLAVVLQSAAATTDAEIIAAQAHEDGRALAAEPPVGLFDATHHTQAQSHQTRRQLRESGDSCPVNATWPRFRNDNQNSGANGCSTLQQDPNSTWVFDFSQDTMVGAITAWMSSTNASVPETPLLLTASARTQSIYAINITDGTLFWSQQLGQSLGYIAGVSPPSNTNDLYVTCDDCHGLYHVNLENGTSSLLYTIDNRLDVLWSPFFLSSDGPALLALSKSLTVLKIDIASGDALWQYSVSRFGDSSFPDSFAVSRNESVAVFCFNTPGTVIRLDMGSTRTVLWSRVIAEKDEYLRSSAPGPALLSVGTPVIVEGIPGVEDMVLVTGLNHTFFAISLSTGDVLWRFSANGDFVTMTPTVFANGIFSVAYIAARPHQLFAIRLLDGTQEWMSDLGQDCYAPSLAAGDGVLILPCQNGWIQARSVADGSFLWLFDARKAGILGDAQASVIIAPNSTLFAVFPNTAIALIQSAPPPTPSPTSNIGHIAVQAIVGGVAMVVLGLLLVGVLVYDYRRKNAVSRQYYIGINTSDPELQ